LCTGCVRNVPPNFRPADGYFNGADDTLLA
jgi:hypothetical protein